MIVSRPWFLPRPPDQIVPYPWLHPAAVEYLEQLLQPDWWVLEHGAGGSTLWLAERVKHLVSVEHDPAWTLKVRELAPANVIIVSYLPDFESHTYDLFFIDGERMERAACLKAAHLLVKPGGWIVLDNANRPEYAEERAGLKQHAKLEARFDNNIPRSLYFVTEFYKCASV